MEHPPTSTNPIAPDPVTWFDHDCRAGLMTFAFPEPVDTWILTHHVGDFDYFVRLYDENGEEFHATGNGGYKHCTFAFVQKPQAGLAIVFWQE